MARCPSGLRTLSKPESDIGPMLRFAIASNIARPAKRLARDSRGATSRGIRLAAMRGCLCIWPMPPGECARRYSCLSAALVPEPPPTMAGSLPLINTVHHKCRGHPCRIPAYFARRGHRVVPLVPALRWHGHQSRYLLPESHDRT